MNTIFHYVYKISATNKQIVKFPKTRAFRTNSNFMKEQKIRKRSVEDAFKISTFEIVF